jgi:hypothetical protein
MGGSLLDLLAGAQQNISRKRARDDPANCWTEAGLLPLFADKPSV